MNEPNQNPNQDNLQSLEQQAIRYVAQDGITEFLAGILFFFIAMAVVHPHLAWVPALLLFPMRFAHNFFKNRFTYPRVGYVKLKSEDSRGFGRGVLTFLAAVLFIIAVALWIFGDITSWDQWMKWLPALMGGFCSGGFIYMAGKTGFLRHYFLVAWCIGWGIACSVMEIPDPYQAIQRWTLGLGLMCLLMGASIFINFLRTHPVRPVEVADEQV